MSKKPTHKRTRHLQGQIKALQAELKRLKKNQPLDKDEIEYDSKGNDVSEVVIPCIHCKVGFMSTVEVVGKLYWQCSSCDRMKKA